jgi:F-box-like
MPSELVDLIFSFLPLSTLPVAMRTCKLFHAIAERQLYFTVHSIDFFPHVDQQRCLETIANRASAAESVRHFGVRGLPWLEDEDLHLLSVALRAMAHLQSLDIDLGAPPEHDLLHPEPPLSPNLEALNVVDPWSAKFACEGSVRPIRIARIASPMDECTAREVMPALGQSTGPLQQLQIGLHLLSMADAVDVLNLLARKLPCLQTLGVEIRTVKKVEDQDFEVSMFF